MFCKKTLEKYEKWSGVEQSRDMCLYQ